MGFAWWGVVSVGESLLSSIQSAWLDREVFGPSRVPSLNLASPRAWLSDAVWILSMSLLAGTVAALAGLLLAGRTPSPGALRTSMAGRWGALLVVGLSFWLPGQVMLRPPASAQPFAFLLSIAGVIVWPAVFLVVPALVLEHRNVPSALLRSIALSRGSRWMLFGLSGVTAAPSLIALYATTKLALLGYLASAFLVGTPVLLVLVGLALIAPAAAFHLLRAAKEGAAAGALAEVFE